MKLTGKQKHELGQLAALGPFESLWSGVEPYNSDEDLSFYLANGLVRHRGERKGYAITDAGRAALERSEG